MIINLKQISNDLKTKYVTPEQRKNFAKEMIDNMPLAAFDELLISLAEFYIYYSFFDKNEKI